MASKVTICNLALAKLGASSDLISITDNTVEAKLCNLWFNQVVDDVISEGYWSSTIRRTSLSLTTNTPAYGYSYEFQLPVDPFCLKVIEINEEVPGTYDYEIEGDKLLANVSTISILYAARLTDTQGFGPFLTRAIISKLALETAYATTADAGLVNKLEEAYERDVMKGLSSDGQQGSAKSIVSPSLIEVR